MSFVSQLVEKMPSVPCFTLRPGSNVPLSIYEAWDDTSCIWVRNTLTLRLPFFFFTILKIQFFTYIFSFVFSLFLFSVIIGTLILTRWPFFNWLLQKSNNSCLSFDLNVKLIMFLYFNLVLLFYRTIVFIIW